MFVFLSHSGFLLSINWYAKTNNNLCNICPVVFAFVIGKSICEARAAKTKPRLLFGINRNARKIQGIRTQIEPKYTSANMALQSVSKYNHSTWMHIIVPEYVFPLSQPMIAHYCSFFLSLVLSCSWICLLSICVGVGCRNVIGISIWETANAALAKPRISSRQICYNKSITMEKGASFQYLQYHEKWISW